jgi:hypothetical protein
VLRATSRLQEVDYAKPRGRGISFIAASPNAFWTTRHPLPIPQRQQPDRRETSNGRSAFQPRCSAQILLPDGSRR